MTQAGKMTLRETVAKAIFKRLQEHHADEWVHAWDGTKDVGLDGHFDLDGVADAAVWVATEVWNAVVAD